MTGAGSPAGAVLLYEASWPRLLVKFVLSGLFACFVLYAIGETRAGKGFPLVVSLLATLGLGGFYFWIFRKAPDRIYGARDGIWVVRRGMVEKILHADIGGCGVNYGYKRPYSIITLNFLDTGNQFGSFIRFPVAGGAACANAFTEALRACAAASSFPLQAAAALLKASAARIEAEEKKNKKTWVVIIIIFMMLCLIYPLVKS
ncbi:MAG: hypothetical protein LBK55_00550 [Azoarcus sp.]|jgi:hypothetical protein|nr:hypothetical protein [Azoarcus sp.]